MHPQPPSPSLLVAIAMAVSFKIHSPPNRTMWECEEKLALQKCCESCGSSWNDCDFFFFFSHEVFFQLITLFVACLATTALPRAKCLGACRVLIVLNGPTFLNHFVDSACHNYEKIWVFFFSFVISSVSPVFFSFNNSSSDAHLKRFLMDS